MGGDEQDMRAKTTSRPSKRKRLPEPDFSVKKTPVKIPRARFESSFETSNQQPSKIPRLPPKSIGYRVPDRLESKHPRPTSPSKPFRHLKPPPRPSSILAILPGTSDKGKASASRTSLTSHRSHTPIAQDTPGPSRLSRRQHPPDISSFLGQSSAISLRALKPPPTPIDPSLPDPSTMKTISTTRIARATNPFSESGPIELLSIFMDQHNGPYVGPIEREMRRGLLQSPEKGSKPKGKKYIRGGLADMASRLFSRSSTSQSLWETDFEKRVRSSRGPTPELRLRVSSIHYVSQIIKTRAQTPASLPPRLTLASCRIVSTTDRERGNTGDELTVLFRFEVRPNEKQKDINQGSEVWVWRPYQYVEISHDIARSLKMIANGGVLFCSRFHIPPSSES